MTRDAAAVHTPSYPASSDPTATVMLTPVEKLDWHLWTFFFLRRSGGCQEKCPYVQTPPNKIVPSLHVIKAMQSLKSRLHEGAVCLETFQLAPYEWRLSLEILTAALYYSCAEKGRSRSKGLWVTCKIYKRGERKGILQKEQWATDVDKKPDSATECQFRSGFGQGTWSATSVKLEIMLSWMSLKE